MKTCMNCATPNADQATSCSRCGALLSTPSAAESETIVGPWKPPPPGGGTPGGGTPGGSWQGQPPGGGTPGGPWQGQPPGGGSAGGPWQGQPPGGGSAGGPWQGQPPGGGTPGGPWQGPPPGGTVGGSWQAPAARPASTGFKLDIERWSVPDRVVGGATLILFISLFLPWFTYGGSSVDGLWHGYEYLTLIIALGIIGYLIARAAIPSFQPNMPVSHDMVLLAASAINLLLVLIGFLARPSASAFFVTVTASWGFGAFLALIAALAATIAAVRPVLAARARQ
jgi:hypothetical protein